MSNHDFDFSDVNDALPRLCRSVLAGAEVGARGGTQTKELTHVGIALHTPWRREMLVPDRKVNIAAQIAETMWILAGRNDIEFLSHYLSRAEQFSDDGEVWRGGYGPRLRKWEKRETDGVFDDLPTDQLAEVVKILKEDSGSRRAVMSIFDPAVDYIDSKDIPCNNWLSFLIRDNKLSLHVAIRSNDLMWGWSGINAFEWSVLQEVVAGLVGAEVGDLHFSTTSLHLYNQHWTKAQKLAQATPIQWNLQDSPRFHIDEEYRDIGSLDNLTHEWFGVEELIREGKRVDELVDKFPEPMMRSWLRVLQWWWTGDISHVSPLVGTRLHGAVQLAVQPKREDASVPSVIGAIVKQVATGEYGPLDLTPQPSAFIEFAIKTHNEKDAAYGDSWKKRGEMLGIMANIARKIDRLGGSETADESSADTAMDLMVYLAKYDTWLLDQKFDFRTGHSNDTSMANEVMRVVDREMHDSAIHSVEALEAGLRTSFDSLEVSVEGKLDDRADKVAAMLKDAYRLARTLWEKQTTRDRQRDNALRNEKTKWDPTQHPRPLNPNSIHD